jgi:hypothetical protein
LKTNKGVAVVLAAAILASGGGVASSVLTATPAQAATVVTTPAQVSAAVAKLLADTNAARKAAGLAPLTLSPVLNTVAQGWTDKAAAEGLTGSNPDLRKQMPASISNAVGQTPIVGADADWAISYLINNSPDSKNIILGNYTHIGIGYSVTADGTPYITQNFGNYTLTPSKPRPSVFTPDATSLSMKWLPPVKEESMSDYKVELYSASGALLQTQTLKKTYSDLVFADFSGLTPETTYTIKTTARNASVMGVEYFSPTRVETATTTKLIPAPQAPNAPTALVATNTLYNQTTLTWKAPTGVVGTITGYDIIAKTAGKPNLGFSTDGTSYTLTGLSANTAYTLEVTANVLGENQQTRVVSPVASIAVQTPVFYPVSVNEPTNLNLSAMTHEAVTASWKAPTGTIGNLVNYTVKVRTATGEKSYTTAATSYRVTGLAPNTGYSLTVTANAVSADGLNRASSTEAASIFTTLTTPSPIVKVAAPVTTISGVGADRLTVSWTKPAVTGTLTGYRVTVKQGIVVQSYNLSAVTTSKQILALAENTSYTVIVEALATAPNGINKAVAPTTQTVKTGFTAASTVKVAAPTAFSTAVSRTGVTASWRMPAVTGKVVNYTVTLKEGTRVVKTVLTGAGKYSFTGLKANTAYTVTVTANAASANGKYKASASVSKLVRTLL